MFNVFISMSKCKNACMNEEMRSLTSYEALRIAFISLSFGSQICEMNCLNNKLEALPVVTLIANASNSRHLLITYQVLTALYMLSLNLHKSQGLESM